MLRRALRSAGRCALSPRSVSAFRWSRASLLHSRPSLASRTALDAGGKSDGLLTVTRDVIMSTAQRSGDTSIWHDSPGAAYRESSLLRARMHDAALPPDALLGHGATVLHHALRTAYRERPDLELQGIREVRYRAPVFEGAGLTATVQWTGTDAQFVVTSDQLDNVAVLTGGARYVPGEHPADALFSFETCAGLVSHVLGLGIEERGCRVLYMGQALALHHLLAVGDVPEATAEVLAVEPWRHIGDRITLAVRVTVGTVTVAVGESTVLVMEPNT